MKNNHFLRFCCLLAVPLLWGGCSWLKNDDAPLDPVEQLPPITTTGEGVFACLFNGEPWVSCGWSLKKSSVSAAYGFDRFQITGRRFCGGQDEDIVISINIKTSDSLGLYPPHRISYNDFNLACQDAAVPYELLDSADNWVEILRMDWHDFIASGLFQCTLVHAKCGDTIHITEGRFDYKWAN